jgi:hypothetical protein
MEGFLPAAILAKVAQLRNPETQCTEFGALREDTRLKPELLVEALDELRGCRLITFERNATGNPYGILRVTAIGEHWLQDVGPLALLALEHCPRQLKISAPERSTRRGRRRTAEVQP